LAISSILPPVLLPLLHTFTHFVEVSIKDDPALGFVGGKIFVEPLVHPGSHYLPNIPAKLSALLLGQVLTLEGLVDPLPHLAAIRSSRLQGFHGKLLGKLHFVVSDQHNHSQCRCPHKDNSRRHQCCFTLCETVNIHSL
jgi:hypothetical protein